MIPLLFILLVTGVSIYCFLHFSAEISWFTYYLGGVVGLLVSSLMLEIWTRKKRKEKGE